MNKDVIYIDIEDDITGIIDKVKNAGTKIVALVPPKRIGTLQSAVNLKLLQKAALEVDKRVVLITNDRSLTTLAAGVKMPVAKNLQSRPEIPQLAILDTPDEEIINGKELPVGDVASSLTPAAAPKPDAQKSAAEDLDDKVDLASIAAAPVAAQKAAPKKMDHVAKVKSKLNIPNFDTFRKRVFLFGGLGALLIVFLVWAFVFAPRATVTISAKTSNVNIERTLALNPAAPASDPTKFTLKPNVQQLKKAVVAEFQATGTKDIGERAKGSITIRNCDNSDGFTLPAGTRFTAGSGQVFVADQSISVPKFTGSANSCTLSGNSSGKATVAVTAADIGEGYNIPGQAYSFNGSIPGSVDALGGAMAGGSKQTVKVVSQADVDKAKESLGAQNADAAKAELKKQFTDDSIIIDESYSAEQAAPSVSPAVGEQASAAKLTVETTYTYVSIARSDIKTILNNAINDTLKDKSDQQMYSTGENTIVFQTFEKQGAAFTARMSTTGQIGPKIDTQQLAKQLAGKRFGEIQAIVNQITGVNNVDINFSPFWVTTAPGADKIDIKFSVAPSGGNGQ
jgi:hypothetical protein